MLSNRLLLSLLPLISATYALDRRQGCVITADITGNGGNYDCNGNTIPATATATSGSGAGNGVVISGSEISFYTSANSVGGESISVGNDGTVVVTAPGQTVSIGDGTVAVNNGGTEATATGTESSATAGAESTSAGSSSSSEAAAMAMVTRGPMAPFAAAVVGAVAVLV